MSVKSIQEYEGYYDTIQPQDMLSKIFNLCLDKSVFFSDKEAIMEELEDISQVYLDLMIDKPAEDYVWPLVNNDVSNQVDGYLINAELLDTNIASELYSYTTTRKIAEIVTDYEIDDSIERVPPLSHSVGIAMTYLSEALSSVYEHFKEQDLSVADVTADIVANSMGDYTSIDWFQKPVVSKSLDNDRSRYVRSVWNYLLMTVQPGSRILSVGGDCGSASCRVRDYFIDCLYFDKQKYESAKRDRRKYGSKGRDYLYKYDFDFDINDPAQWSVCTFNYYAERSILLELREVFKDTTCQVWGILCSPDWDDSECIYSQDPYEFKDLGELPINVEKANFHHYQIIGRNGNKVALYTTHGRFEDVIIDYHEDWLHEVPLEALDRVLPRSHFKGNYLHSLRHSSLFVIDTLNEKNFFSTALFPIHDFSIFSSNIYIYYIKGRSIFDEHNVFSMNLPFGVEIGKYDGVKIKMYRGPIMLEDGTILEGDHTVALDINIVGSYFKRRSLLSDFGFKIYTYGNVSSSYKRTWNDPFDSNYCSLLQLLDLVDDGSDVYKEIKQSVKLSSGNIQSDFTELFPVLGNRLNNRSYIRDNYALFPVILVKNVSYNPLLKSVVHAEGFDALLLYRGGTLISRDTFNHDKMVDVLLVHDHGVDCDKDLCDCLMFFTTELFTEGGIPFTFVFLKYSFDFCDSRMDLGTKFVLNDDLVAWKDFSEVEW